MFDHRILLTRREAAKACGLCEKTLANHTAPKGKLVGVKIGRAIRYTPADIQRFAEEMKLLPSPDQAASPQGGQ